MASLSVPENALRAFTVLARLPDAAFLELVASLSSCPPNFSADRFADRVGAALSQIKPQDAKQMIQAVIGLHYAKVQAGKSASEISGDVVKAVAESTPDLQRQSELLGQRLSQLLEVESLVVTAKALTILAEHERVFLRARILTDMRPIFRDDVATDPVAALVVHVLKLEYHRFGRTEEFFVALDSGDISALAGVIKRAEAKEVRVSDLLSRLGLPHLRQE